ncbi:SNF1-related kinase regulatory subunit beta-2 [Olea europaea subsp. europaea]|uniref:SNF1-related kinase regulatory subunit beta-2 n=1 Tax=Olea europaea subsp. europaea TaxID=158383 RepID=A0A8S0S783_OLEEU|nr:SNF1-related kinase regulatory subunit beta-2 [Olea europaea subsp. europaea]
MPLVPLQRPEELNNSSPSWMQTTSRYEDVCNEKGIPTMITWSLDGKEVAVEGSWDDWKTRFIVEGQWRYSPDFPWAQDESGNAYNILDLQEYVPEDIDNISGFEPPQSPDASYNNLQLGPEDYAKEPPVVPPHLQLTLLNALAPQMEIPPPFLRPQHVVLNHLYMQKGRGSPVVALGSTHRFHSKYVTVVLYKSIKR